MRRPSSVGPDPNEDESLIERVRSAFDGLLDRFRGGPPEQALPMDRVRGQAGPITPYEQRRQQLTRYRRSQHGPVALVFFLVMLVLVILIFYGLSSVLGGFGSAGQRTPTPISVSKPSSAVTPVTTASPIVPVNVLPTAAPGGNLPSPSPLAKPGAPGPGTPDAGASRTYIVKAGDTLSQIARDNSVSVDSLMRTNNISDPRQLRVGQELKIPPANTPTPTTR
jgi:LysM repeat protein